MAAKENSGLKRQLGAGSLAINAMNLTIGTGIFILPAYVAGYLGAMGFLAYLFCSLLIGLIMLCFAEMGSTKTSSGGAYTMIKDAFGPLAGFLSNTLLWLGYGILSDAAVINVMSNMLGLWFPSFYEFWFRSLFIFAVIAVFALVNILGLKSGIRMVIILTILKLTPLVLLVVIGIFSLQAENLMITALPDLTTFGAACLLLFFAFQGSESALNISGEMKNPGKTIPRGIFIGIAGILVIYLLIQFVATGVLGTELALFQEAPLAEVAIRLVGPVGGIILIAAGVISMYAVVGGDILVTSRLPFVASENGLLPKMLSRVHPKYKSPYISIILFCSLLFIMSISGGFKTLAILASSAVLIIYLGVVLAMFKRRLKPNLANPPMFIVPGGLLVPILSLIVLVWILSYVPFTEYVAIGIFFIVATLYYYGYAWWKKTNRAKVDLLMKK
ncbi:APC family permease [Zeaxanthinibacter sp. PT1]|uniref:APC family permease n=1 Tax=Zeaxanthinibacter TaxID=561554 RepID=UPI00234BE0E3|nr:APC family permease [Zeaxanthinibacter sp. PT1]MDC6350083.1 APC family permease [Zeaxanthinibacter sp. PT1]